MTFVSPIVLYIALVLGCLNLVIAVFLLWEYKRLNRLRKEFLTGKNGADLEAVIYGLRQELNALGQQHLTLDHTLAVLQQEFNFAVQKIGLVRFNPFDDGGGNFSFSLALLNGHNTGVVITSMHGRQQNRIYTKRILSGTSETALTEEEQQAILLANQKTKLST